MKNEMYVVDYTKDKNAKHPEPKYSIKKEAPTWTEYWLEFPEYKVIQYNRWDDPDAGIVERIIPARKESTRQKLFQAIGGIYTGENITEYDAHSHGYFGFNSAGYCSHSKIWVHEDELQ